MGLASNRLNVDAAMRAALLLNTVDLTGPDRCYLVRPGVDLAAHSGSHVLRRALDRGRAAAPAVGLTIQVYGTAMSLAWPEVHLGCPQSEPCSAPGIAGGGAAAPAVGLAAPAGPVNWPLPPRQLRKSDSGPPNCATAAQVRLGAVENPLLLGPELALLL